MPSTGLHRHLFLTGGTCPCISSLIHEGGGGGWTVGRDTSSSRFFALPLIYSEKHDYIAAELWQWGPAREGKQCEKPQSSRWGLG